MNSNVVSLIPKIQGDSIKDYCSCRLTKNTFVRLRESHAQESLRSDVLSFWLNTWNTKTKGALEAVCIPTLKSVLGLGNTKTIYVNCNCVC